MNKWYGTPDKLDGEVSLVELVKYYYEKRGLTYPNFDNSMKFVATEIAEVYELDLARTGGWIRNNPQSKPSYSKESMAEELGDAIMMLIVAGIQEGVDPIDAMTSKIKKKLSKISGESTKEIQKEEPSNMPFGNIKKIDLVPLELWDKTITTHYELIDTGGTVNVDELGNYIIPEKKED